LFTISWMGIGMDKSRVKDLLGKCFDHFRIDVRQVDSLLQQTLPLTNFGSFAELHSQNSLKEKNTVSVFTGFFKKKYLTVVLKSQYTLGT
jgi:hypothetical protein